MTNGDRKGIPLRTLADVQAALAQAKWKNADVALGDHRHLEITWKTSSRRLPKQDETSVEHSSRTSRPTHEGKKKRRRLLAGTSGLGGSTGSASVRSRQPNIPGTGSHSARSPQRHPDHVPRFPLGCQVNVTLQAATPREVAASFFPTPPDDAAWWPTFGVRSQDSGTPKQAQTTRRRYGSLAQPGPVALPG